MDEEVARVLVTALSLQAEYPRTFTERDLGLPPGTAVEALSRAPNLVRRTLRSPVCPACGSTADVDIETSIFPCQCGDIVDLSAQPRWEYSLQRAAAVQALVGRLKDIGQIAGMAFQPSDHEGFDLGCQVFGKSVVAKVLPKKAALTDFFQLRGSLSDPRDSVLLLAAPAFEERLSNYLMNDPVGWLLPLDLLLESEFASELKASLEARAREIQNERGVEAALKAEFAEIREAADLADRLSELVSDLPRLSLQIGPEEGADAGRRFERAAAAVMSFGTPFRVFLLGGQDEQDGVIRIFPRGDKRPAFFPWEAKSFGGNIETKPHLALAGHMEQIRRYMDAWLQEAVTRIYRVPGFVVAAHDFDPSDERTKDAVEAFTRDYHAQLILLPVRSIIQLADGFLTLGLDWVDSDRLEAFFLGNAPYISQDRVTEFLAELQRLRDREAQDSTFRLVRSHARTRR